MKRILAIICILFALSATSGCTGDIEMINKLLEQYTDVEIPEGNNGINIGGDVTGVEPMDPVDISDVEIISSFKTNLSGETIRFSVNGDKLNVSGTLDDDVYQYLAVMFERSGEIDENNKIQVVNRNFNADITIPSGINECIVDLYGGMEEYGTYESIIIDFIVLKNTGNGYGFLKSPVYDSNVKLFSQPRDVSEALKPTNRIQADNPEIKRLSDEITAGCSDDYSKLKAIHDWVAENIYYDYDVLATGNFENMDAIGVYNSKRGVCEGYANLFAAFAICQNIPCRVQGGYGLGVDTHKRWNEDNVNIAEGNHAWNEAYVNGRWIIIDSTWDSQNEYRGGTYTKGNYVGNVFFDVDMEYFSMSHKLMNS